VTTRTATGQTTQAADAVSWYQRTFHGRTDQVSQVRRDIAAYPAGCPAADDLILIASELAGNAVLHSQSRGGSFTVRCYIYPGYGWIEVEDLGGPWRSRQLHRGWLPAKRTTPALRPGSPITQTSQEEAAMLRMCERGLATSDPGLLEGHLSQYGHRERVPWWDKYTQAILARW
jgi:anti-sigma regulatory factor (Ser/Thr protein kinase)